MMKHVVQCFPIFLFGKLMKASGSVEAIAKYLTERLGTKRALLAVVLAGEFVTYGGVSLFVAFFVPAPMGHVLFKAANIPQRLWPPIALGRSLRRSIDALAVPVEHGRADRLLQLLNAHR